MNGLLVICDMPNNDNRGAVSPRIIRRRFDSLSLYEISDYELSMLEEGTLNSIFLNFAIFFFSIGASFLTTLVTVDIPAILTFVIFVLLTIIGFAASLVLFVLWYRGRSKIKDLIQTIKSREPETEIIDTKKEIPTFLGITENNK